MLDRGIVIGLFVVTFMLAIYKGIPSALAFARETLDKVNAEHTHQIALLTQSHEKTVEAITQRFIVQIERQHEEQKKHHEEHGRVLELVAQRVESCETFLKTSKNGRSK